MQEPRGAFATMEHEQRSSEILQVLQFKDGQLRALEQEATGLRRRVAECEAETDGMRSDLLALEAALQEAETGSRHCHGRLAEAQQELRATDDELAALRAARETWQELSDVARELREENSTLRREADAMLPADEVDALRARLDDSEAIRKREADAAEESRLRLVGEVDALRAAAADAEKRRVAELASQEQRFLGRLDEVKSKAEDALRRAVKETASVGVQAPFWSRGSPSWDAGSSNQACSGCAKQHEEVIQLQRLLESTRDEVQRLRTQASAESAGEVASLRSSKVSLKQQLGTATAETRRLRVTLLQLRESHDRQAVQWDERSREWADALAEAKALAASALHPASGVNQADSGGSSHRGNPMDCRPCREKESEIGRLREKLSAAQAVAKRTEAYQEAAEQLSGDLARQLANAQALLAVAPLRAQEEETRVASLVDDETASLRASLAEAKAALEATQHQRLQTEARACSTMRAADNGARGIGTWLASPFSDAATAEQVKAYGDSSLAPTEGCGSTSPGEAILIDALEACQQTADTATADLKWTAWKLRASEEQVRALSAQRRTARAREIVLETQLAVQRAQILAMDSAAGEWQERLVSHLQRHRQEAEADAGMWRLRSLEAQKEVRPRRIRSPHAAGRQAAACCRRPAFSPPSAQAQRHAEQVRAMTTQLEDCMQRQWAAAGGASDATLVSEGPEQVTNASS